MAEYEFHRKFHSIILNGFAELEGDELANARIRYLAGSAPMKYIHNGLYQALTRKKQMAAFGEQPKEYQDELWRIAEDYMPKQPLEYQLYFIQALMAFLWLLNN